MTKVLSQLVAVFALLVILGPIPSFQSPEHPLATQVYVTPTLISEPIDTQFTLTVGIADVVDLSGFDVRIGWDPAVLDYVSHIATPENVLNLEGAVVFTLVNTANPTAGTYQLAVATLPATSFTGSGTIFTLTLKAKIEGVSDLAFQLHDLANPSAEPIPHTTVEGVFDNRPSVVQYELTIGVSGSGTTDPVPGAYMYDEGTVVPVTAMPDSGWMLDYWLLDSVDVGDVNPYSVTMDSDHALTAVFVEIPAVQYELTISVIGSGTTTPAVGAYMYDEDTVVPVTAFPADGWSLDYWLLDSVNVGSTNPYSVTMDADHALTAVFIEVPPVQYELIISVTGMGTTDPAPGSYMYNAGTIVAVTALPDSGWMLDYWLLDSVDVGDVNPYSVTMDSNHALTAVFIEVPPPVQYELTISVSGSGTTTPAVGAYMYDEGTVVPVTALADSGWMLDYWLLDSVDVGDVNPYSVTMDSDHTLTAVFVEIPVGLPELSSCDDTGAEKKEFNIAEPVFVSGEGFDPEEEFTVYVVLNGAPFDAASSIFSMTVQADASGVLAPAQLGLFPVGEYDWWVDRNGNGVLDPATEPVDDFDLAVSGFFVIPEFFAGTILGLLACFAAFSTLFLSKRRKK